MTTRADHTDRDGIFAGDDPVATLRAWLDEARGTEVNDPEAVALATVDAEGMPNVRAVLLKGIEGAWPDPAFLFYTNYGSAKARELDAAGRAALLLHWKSLRRQVRIRGTVAREDGPVADAYFASRHPESRLGAWASRQSAPLASRADLLAAAAEARARLGDDPPRPPFWGGYRLRPVEIELWADGPHRLHDRFRWTRAADGSMWDVTRLYP